MDFWAKWQNMEGLVRLSTPSNKQFVVDVFRKAESQPIRKQQREKEQSVNPDMALAETKTPIAELKADLKVAAMIRSEFPL